VNVVEFEPACASLAVRAVMLPLGEQIILDLCFKQGPLLILLPLNLWVLQESQVETHHLLRKCAHRAPALQALDPGKQVKYPAQ
jgi:hypothetical protein